MDLEKISDAKLKTVLDRLVPAFAPKKVYLFGSRAIGNAKSESDYDLLLVVSSSEKTRHQRMIQAMDLLWDTGISVDVFIYTEAEFDEWKSEPSSIPNTVLTQGVEISL
ncbi:MAG: nucleotidyltransferase domain-containing protein [Pseudobdellovibrionaceae bacterium]